MTALAKRGWSHVRTVSTVSAATSVTSWLNWVIDVRIRVGLWFVVSLVLLCLTGLLPVGIASADTTTQLAGLTFSRSGASLRGLQVAYVDVAVHLVDPEGIPIRGGVIGDQGFPCPCVLLVNTRVVEPRSQREQAVPLHLSQGTATDGVWSGRFAVGAAQAGFWQPRVMDAGDLHDNAALSSSLVAVPAPFSQVTLNVRGSDWPFIWLGTRGRARPGVDLVRGGAYLSRSRTPLAGTRLEIRDTCDQGGRSHYYAGVRTDARGAYAFSVPTNHQFLFGVCAARVAYPTDNFGSLVAKSNIRSLPPSG